jgi:hypothetical protein
MLQILQIVPFEVPVGGTVNVFGFGFGPGQAGSQILLGSMSLPVTSWADGQITATIPANALSGFVTVTVAGVPSNSVELVIAGDQPAVNGFSNGNLLTSSSPISITNFMSLPYGESLGTHRGILVTGDPGWEWANTNPGSSLTVIDNLTGSVALSVSTNNANNQGVAVDNMKPIVDGKQWPIDFQVTVIQSGTLLVFGSPMPLLYH